MRYVGMPVGMWLLFVRSFRRQLTAALGMDGATASRVTGDAKKRYKAIVAALPTFEKGDRFEMNILSCAMLCAFLKALPTEPTLEQVTTYYRDAMMIGPVRWFCRMGGRQKFTDRDVRGMRAAAALNAADRNPYSWNMEFLPYPDGSGYEARFSKCGICQLMREQGLFRYTPAMCRLDYDMSEVGGATDFVRRYTLASGGPYCDCGYMRKGMGT